jgi:PhnB protein
MSKATRPIPAGHEGLIPHLVCDPCADAIEFYKRAFGAEEVHRVPAPDGRRIMHAAIRIGGSFVFLVDDFPEFSRRQGVIAEGVERHSGHDPSLCRRLRRRDHARHGRRRHGSDAAQDMFWGDRYGVVTDPFGHHWSFATHLKDLTPAEVEAAMKEAFAQRS